MFRFAFLLAVALLPLGASAEEVAVLIDSAKPGTYLVTVAADGSVSAVPLRVVRVNGQPSPPTVPTDPTAPPTAPTAFAAEVSKLTKAAIDSGGSPTTAAALSAVYSLVSGGAEDGSITKAQALGAVKIATDTVLANVTDAAKWTKWRTDLSAALETLKQQGVLKLPSALDEIAAGIDATIGKRIDPTKLAGLSDAQKNAQAAILDGIDLAKLLQLIQLVLELLKIFKG